MGLVAWWNDARVRFYAGQGGLIVLVSSAVYWLVDNTMDNLAARGIRVGFEFLRRQANFPISESLVPFDSTDTFFWAYVAGIGNTLAISAATILLATILGTGIGLARRARHPMVAGVSGVLVTVVRNMPLIVQLLFWYALATTLLPAPRLAWSPFEGVYLSLRGLYVPWLSLDAAAWGVAAAGSVALFAVWRFTRSNRRAAFALWLIGMIASWHLLGATLSVDMPKLTGFNFTGGFRMSAEFVALMVGLVLYSAVYIGEVVRGGIDAVAKGQWEAARALGLRERHILLRVIVPQALRIIIPPLTTQYHSTVKNTTLAVAIGFPELGLVVGTIINQTGQALESIAVLLAVFLTINAAVSLAMNSINARLALVTR